jgi:Arc/MetJ family transcription regulator
MHMRTTIELSDSLLARARKVMAKRKTTLRALVEEGLGRVLNEERPVRPFQLREASFSGEPGFVNGVGAQDISRVLGELNEGRPLP